MTRFRTLRLLEAPGSVPLSLEDAPGYWLTPAAEALSLLVQGADAETAIAEATGRDSARTALFLTLALTQIGRPDDAVRWLEEAFPALGGTTTKVQRTLWLAGAEGAYGAAGRLLVARRLADFLATPNDEEDAEGGRWAEAVRGVSPDARSALPSPLAANAALAEPLTAANRLAGLRASIEKGLAADGAGAETPDVRRLLTALIEEGAPEERELLTRARELRQIIENGRPATGQAWDDAAGPTLELLRTDAFGARPGPRELALRAGARWLTAIADDLAARAAVRPPDEISVRIAGSSVRLRRSGPVSLGEAEEYTERTHAVGETPERAGLAAAAAGVLMIGLGAAVSVALVVLGVPVLVAGGAVWFAKRRSRSQAAMWVEEEKARLRQTVTATAEALDAHYTRCVRAGEAAAADRDAVKALLG